MAMIKTQDSLTATKGTQSKLGERCHALAKKNQARRKELADQEWEKHCQKWLKEASTAFQRHLEESCLKAAQNGRFACDILLNSLPTVPLLYGESLQEGLGQDRLTTGCKYGTFDDCAQVYYLRYVDRVLSHVTESRLGYAGPVVEWHDHTNSSLSNRCFSLKAVEPPRKTKWEDFKKCNLEARQAPKCNICFHHIGCDVQDKLKEFDMIVKGIKIMVDWANDGLDNL